MFPHLVSTECTVYYFVYSVVCTVSRCATEYGHPTPPAGAGAETARLSVVYSQC